MTERRSARAAIGSGLAALGALALGGGVLAGCGEDGGGAPEVSVSEIEPIHVHGMGVNPADGSLFLATHTGLYRVAEGESEAEPVGDNYQDTMGFTVVGADNFLGSGHPDARTDLPPYLGLIESSDAGERWSSVSLLGRADFHVLETSGRRVYGFGSDFRSREEQFLVSEDGGRRWRELPVPESLISLAISPEDPDELLVSGRRTLFESDDGGRLWRRVPGPPGLLAWPEPGLRQLITMDGAVLTAGGAGAPGWRDAGELGGAPAAFEAESADELYAALHDGRIVRSEDGGSSWSERSSP